MSVVSGVISRRVLPACGSLCCFCPGLRTRSRQPVKRYKKLIADIFPTHPDEEPNDRKIGKLCEYAVRNPLRIPKKDATYMFNLEKFIPKLCHLAQEVGEDARVEPLRAAGLQALSAMVFFMGKYSHMSPEFDNIVSVVLENYGAMGKDSDSWVQDVLRNDRNTTPSDALTKLPSWRTIVNDKGEVTMSAFWSRVCLHNMAKLAKEATTMRRILESLFRYFDNENLWPVSRGVAFPVLKDMQTIIDESGEITHFLLSVLVKHLDHKNVLNRPNMQLDILEIATSLARETKIQASVAIVGAINDIVRHLRRSIHHSLTDANLGPDVIKWNRNFQEAVDECLVELSSKVGDASPIFDIMAGMMENISNIKIIAQTTVAAVYRTGQIVASLPNMAYNKKAFPEALFHQLLPAMLHQDPETRIGAHRIFAVVLVPSSVCPHSSPDMGSDPKKGENIPRSLSRSVSVFSSSAALFEKMKRERPSLGREKVGGTQGELKTGNAGMMNKVKSIHSRKYSMKNPVTPQVAAKKNDNEGVTLRLSTHQISLLLSSIWTESVFPDNAPENYEAICHTYGLVLLFSRGKNSSREALIRSFQLALSLLNISLTDGESLSPSRRRSLYTLATSMIIISGKAFGLVPIVPLAKSALANKMVDPFLSLVDDCKLTIASGADQINNGFDSKEDNRAAQKSLSEVKLAKDQSTESLAAAVVKHLETIIGSEMSSIKDELMDRFVPDDVPKEYGSEKGQSKDEVSSVFSLDDDIYRSNSETSYEASDLLTVDQLLESVMDSNQQADRMSVCNAPNLTFLEMTNHFEELGMGKQTKMSNLMQNGSNVNKPSSPGVQSGPAGKAGDPSFRLPAASPYDNFMKAAGC
ncbi:hypothetical protein OSB04_001360 [Centaurea solstitialis]|uniref:ARM repeat superfamily protein n=1 Tax=Centaurea solstitialis TaxID=347529 RepID=A0AA38TR57_9ASTR|nr:hypothetical protein OSB04_001360 [Centaurea solstitialis]